jgi:hypothetical protein
MRPMTRLVIRSLSAAGLAVLLHAAPAAGQALRLEGKWQARTSEAIHHIMVRGDSSAQFGDQIARWRVVGDSLWLTIGDGVWMVYGMRIQGDRLTLSGGDLEAAVTLRRVGGATARDRAAAIPGAPPDSARAW